jgi:hypothetical protein
VFAGRVVSKNWETADDVMVFGVWKTVVALASCVELVASIDGVTAVWMTVDVLVSGGCVTGGDGVTAGWVTVVVMVIYCCVSLLLWRPSPCVTACVVASD